MIKGIKEISHKIRKDKIKIQYELEFKKLTNLSDDLVDQFISIKWERGKNEIGESRQVRVVDGKIERFHASHSLSHSQSFNGQVSTFSNGLSSIGSINSGMDSLNGSSGNGNGKYNTIGPSSSKSSDSTSSATPYIELEKIPKTLTRKQSKLLLGNKIDGSNCMSGGSALAISFPNERITFKVHLFSNTIHSKQDHSLQTNFEQKLLNLYIYNKNNILCHTVIDLSLHTEETTFNTIAIPFPSSSLIQPTLYMNIKSTLLKYNGIPIIKASKEIIAKKEFGNFIQPNDGASKLIEYQGEIYYLSSKFNRNSNLTAGNSGGINSIKEEEETSVTRGKESMVINKSLRFELDENNMENQVSNQLSSSEDENVNSNNNYNNEKNSSQSTGSTCDELIEEDHFKTNSLEIAHAKTLVQKNEEIKELNEKIKKLTMDVADQKRLRFSLQSLIDDCREKCLEYEEHFHRSQSLESYAKKQLIAERLEFQKKIERLSTQIKQLQQHQLPQYQSPLNNSINRILDDNGSNVIQDIILGKSDINTPIVSPDTNQESNHKNKLLVDKVDHLLKELDHKKQEIHQLTENNENIQILLNQGTNEKKDLSIQLQESNKKVLELRSNIDKITKEQITVDLKRENEIRKRIKSGAAHIDTNGNLVDGPNNNNKGINNSSFSNFMIQLFKLAKSNPKPFCILVLIIILISYIL